MSIVIDQNTAFESHDIESFGEDPASDEVKGVREILLQTERYSKTVKKAISTSFPHSRQYPKQGENPLADQLKVVR